MGPEILLLAALVIVPISTANLPVVAVQCHRGNDCLDFYECCVLDRKLGHGVCKPMGETASECNTTQAYAWNTPDEIITDFDRCPCQSGEICVPIDNGQQGICSFG